MPSLQLTTNVKIHDAKAFAIEFSKLGADTLKKPETYITVSITYNETLTFAGTFDPAFTLSIVSLDNLNPSANEVYSKVFFDFFEEKLGVKNSRGYIVFTDPGREYLGHQATTFGTIFGKK
ncbi:Tautomerase/MIF superfamily [Crucibulum laeve]|uniref:L-dopachrome isomerase n=1 Tax=Crucibulum laeve TaxID=68775 RepID=A0A5C3LQI6_9AGAR|nr:Tautomerase/MIF superfamily [Crucibulum laeve]